MSSAIGLVRRRLGEVSQIDCVGPSRTQSIFSGHLPSGAPVSVGFAIKDVSEFELLAKRPVNARTDEPAALKTMLSAVLYFVSIFHRIRYKKNCMFTLSAIAWMCLGVHGDRPADQLNLIPHGAP